MSLKLTSAQTKALKVIVSDWDTLDANERSRWGKPYGGFVDWRGSRATLYALIKAGLVEVKYTEMTTSPLLRGAYGRWIGGTRRATHVEIGVRPTQAGRSALSD